jgi:5,10-methylenetetrahydromethanopterin reductase
MEVWLHAFSFAGRVARLARQAEEWGFTGLLVADSQNLNADIWVELALAGAATSRLRLGPGVTNPVTRHPAVTASAAATLQAETGGRAVLGMGRGDSSVTQVGLRPVAVAELERALEAVQGYLRGEEVLVDGTASAIRWLADAGLQKVPLQVAATGPKTIAAAARHAEGVDFAVGAELERLRWATGIARSAAPGELTLGAFINVAVDPDREAARELVRGSVAIFARFATEGAPADGLSNVTRTGIKQLASGYERERHGEAQAPQAQLLNPEFIDRFAVAGDPEEVRDRLAEIGAAGIERLIVVPGSLDADPAAVQESNRRFARDVLPELIGT